MCPIQRRAWIKLLQLREFCELRRLNFREGGPCGSFKNDPAAKYFFFRVKKKLSLSTCAQFHKRRAWIKLLQLREFFEFRAHLFRKRCVVTALKKCYSQKMRQADQIKFIDEAKQRCKLQARAHVDLQYPLSMEQLLAGSGDAGDAYR